MAEDLLTENGVDFERIDISKDEDEMNRIADEAGEFAVPIIEIDNEMIVGFDRKKIMECLEERGAI
jgi:glutaredoxin